MRSLRPTTLVPLLLTLGLALAGCSGSNDPTAPTDPVETPPVEIKTPKSLKINKVSVSAYGDKNGGNWDVGVSVSSRRADLYVTLTSGTTANAPYYVSNVIEDAFSGAPYDFTSSSAGTGLPKTQSAGRDVILELMDDDGLSADDQIGTVKFSPLDSYGNDNAVGFYKTFFGSNDTKVSVSGTWVY